MVMVADGQTEPFGNPVKGRAQANQNDQEDGSCQEHPVVDV